MVDDRFPVNKNDQLVNSNVSRNGAWWMVILEKAFAKWNRNYAALNGGFG